jgi:cell division septum initiation protein DivIVA
MEDIKQTLYSIATQIAARQKEEADAVEQYTATLSLIEGALEGVEGEASAILANAVAQLHEIVGDELNHQERLFKLYLLLTGLKPDAT